MFPIVCYSAGISFLYVRFFNLSQSDHRRCRGSGRAADPERNRSAGQDESEENALKAGTGVEARYGGKSEWRQGEISRVHSNGTYSIHYSDGRKERRVRRHLIRHLVDNEQKEMESRSRRKKGRSNNRKKNGNEKSGARDELSKGMAVDVRLRANGKAMWFKGEIAKVRSNGTFDILYSNGDEELGVEKAFIRKTKSRKSPASKDDEHARKAERSRKPSNWVRWGAKPAGANANGSLDDGDKQFEVGTLIEAKYGGKMKWFKGKISRLNPNGTYDIRYLDGDFERGVKAHLIRKMEKSAYSGSTGVDDDFDVSESDNDSDIGEEFDMSVHSDSDGGADDEFDASASVKSQVNDDDFDSDSDADDSENIAQTQKIDIVRLKTMKFLTLSDRSKSISVHNFHEY